MTKDPQFTAFGWQNPRVNQQHLQSTAVKPYHVAQLLLGNIDAEVLGPYSVADGVSNQFSTIASNDKGYRLGETPYMIAFFEDVLDTDNLIGWNKTGWNINGPMSMPNFNPAAYIDNTGTNILGGNNNNNLVFITEIVNNTGAPHTLYAIIGGRTINQTGGAGV